MADTWNLSDIPDKLKQKWDELKKTKVNVGPGIQAMYDAEHTPIGKTDAKTATTLIENMAGNISPIGMMAGVGAKSADMVALRAAQFMEDQGATAKEVLEKTGWFRGAEGKWRFEIPDEAAKVKSTESATYGSLASHLEHPELYKAYPQLAKIDTMLGKGAKQGVFRQGGREYEPTPSIRAQGITPEEQRSTLLHEAQHAIQHIEGFAPGGASSTYANQLPFAETLGGLGKVLEKYKIPTEDLLQYEGPQGVLDAVWMKMLNKGATAEELAQIGEQKAKVMGMDRLHAWKKYRNIPGEREARTVENRSRMTAEQRRAVSPMESYDATKETRSLNELYREVTKE